MSTERSMKKKPGEPRGETSPPAEGGEAGLREALKEKERLAADYWDQLLRLKAEFENFRKRTDRERPELIKTGRWDLLARLLPVYDVLLSAHQQIQAHHSAGELARGMEMIFREFTRLFESEGVTVIETVGCPCDPNRHEVLGVVERDDVEEDTVVEELQRGFLVEGRVLRPARVRIARKPAHEEAPPPRVTEQLAEENSEEVEE
jgi:molecular chaperone GrpE